MELKATAFADGGKIPLAHGMRAIGGENRSPAFAWSEPPADTRSFAFAIVDPHPVANNWVHWLIIDLPAQARGLDEGASGRALPAGARELNNGWGQPGYGGPQPPKGSGEHPYECTLYALDVANLGLPAATTLGAFTRAIAGHVLAPARTKPR
jgi:hypothetical protein